MRKSWKLYSYITGMLLMAAISGHALAGLPNSGRSENDETETKPKDPLEGQIRVPWGMKFVGVAEVHTRGRDRCFEVYKDKSKYASPKYYWTCDGTRQCVVTSCYGPRSIREYREVGVAVENQYLNNFLFKVRAFSQEDFDQQLRVRLATDNRLQWNVRGIFESGCAIISEYKSDWYGQSGQNLEFKPNAREEDMSLIQDDWCVIKTLYSGTCRVKSTLCIHNQNDSL